MRLVGYTKLTLQDYPGYVAAMCFTGGCQLRCPYCHNPQLVLLDEQNNSVDGEEIAMTFLSYLEQRRLQLDGVVISGGEPLMQQDIEDFLRKIKGLGLAVKLDTNGLLPGKLEELIGCGLVDYVSLDYKSCKEQFAQTVGLCSPEGRTIAGIYYNYWRASLECLRKAHISYELRTTVVQELHPINVLVRMAEEADILESWFLQSFMKKGLLICDYTNPKTALTAYSNEEMQEIKQELLKIAPCTKLRA
jgi:pyruvate formate lyase activating enzyme